MAIHLLGVLLGVCVPQGNGAAPAAAHGPHAMGVLLARAEGYQPPALGAHLGLPGGRQETVKPADPSSGAHSPSQCHRGDTASGNVEEQRAARHLQPVCEQGLGERQRGSVGQQRSQTPTDWKSLENLS